MAGTVLGSLRFEVLHRRPGPEGGPTLHVWAGDGRELLRFDCFLRGAHWHLAPHGPDRIRAMESFDDPIDWTLSTLRTQLVALVAEAGGAAWEESPEKLEALLQGIEIELRNPPLDPDDPSLDVVRSRTGEKWRAYPEDVLAAWVADMDFAVAPPIQRLLERSLAIGDLGYPMHPRPSALPELFAERMESRFAWHVDPSRVELITDVVQGIYIGLQTLSDKGEGVVIQTPVYPPFFGAVRDTGRRCVENLLAHGDLGYEIDLDGLREATHTGTRILLLCNPHNPTGRVFSRAELEGLGALVLERDWIVISDEIHQDLVYAGRTHIPFASLSPELEARTVTLTSASKAFNIAGLRCAVAVFGSADLKKRFLGLPRHARGGLGALGLAATEVAWRHGQPWLDRILAILESNRDFVTRFVADRLPGISLHPPEATYLAWLDCRALELEPDPYRFFLERARVGLSEGRSFGSSGAGFVRINFATSRAILSDVLERMAGALTLP